MLIYFIMMNRFPSAQFHNLRNFDLR